MAKPPRNDGVKLDIMNKGRRGETDALVYNKSNPAPFSDSVCRNERKGPDASKTATYAVGIMEFVVFAYDIVMISFALSQLDKVIDYSLDRWRWLIGTTALIHGVWFAITLVMAGINAYNEVMSDGKSDTARTCVLPQLRWGIVMVGGFAAALFSLWLYLHQMIEDEGLYNSMSGTPLESDRRRFRTKIWTFTFLLSLYILACVVDFFRFADVWMNWVKSTRPCRPDNMTAGVMHNKDVWDGMIGIWNFVAGLNVVGCLVFVLFLAEQLWTHINMWSPSAWRIAAGVWAIVFLALAVMLFGGCFMTFAGAQPADLECLRSHLRRALIFTLFIGFMIGWVWLELWRFIDAGRDVLTTEDFRQRYDNLLWIQLIILSNMLFHATLGEVRCFINSNIRKPLCPRFHDL
jgi:hypothetical protein